MAGARLNPTLNTPLLSSSSPLPASPAAIPVVAVLWSLLGYSLAFGPPGLTNILGDLHYGAFDSGDRLRQGTTVSEHAYFCFQLAFATITVSVVSGAVVQRIKLWAFMLFSSFFLLLVYCPLARWIFFPQGWLADWGVLDFAGGLVVETCSGVSAFVLAFWIGPGQTLHGGSEAQQHQQQMHMQQRQQLHEAEAGQRGTPGGAGGAGGDSHSIVSHISEVVGGGHGGGHHQQPSSVIFSLLGAGLLFICWLFFDAGSALAAGYLTGRAFANTYLSGASAMAMWGVCGEKGKGRTDYCH